MERERDVKQVYKGVQKNTQINKDEDEVYDFILTIAVVEKTLNAQQVFTSAWMPAPPYKINK